MQLIGLPVSGIAYTHGGTPAWCNTLGLYSRTGLGSSRETGSHRVFETGRGGNAGPQDHVYEPYLTIAGHRL